MNAQPRIRILAVDDHPLIRAGLRSMLAAETDLEVIGEAENGQVALGLYRELRPDIVLMDLRMPVMDGVSTIKALLAEFPDARVIVLTTYEGDEDIYRALSAGAKGYVIKDMLRTELITALRQVARGIRGIPPTVAQRLAEHMPRIQLTPRELEVLELMAKALSNREIGAVIGREESTVKVHVRNVLLKLGVEDRTEAVVTAIRRGFLHVE